MKNSLTFAGAVATLCDMKLFSFPTLIADSIFNTDLKIVKNQKYTDALNRLSFFDILTICNIRKIKTLIPVITRWFVPYRVPERVNN